MGLDEVTRAIANRSLRTIRTELQFLQDTSVITQQQFNSIISQLPAENATCAPRETAAPAPAPAPQAPSEALGNLNLNNTVNEKQSSFYQPTPPPSTAPPPAYHNPAPALPPVLSRASALYQYNPTDAGDLALLPNDQIAVTEYMNAEWWKGRNERTGLEGIFPRSYVRVVDEKGAMGPYPPPQPMSYGNGPMEANQPPKQPSQAAEMGKKFGKKLGDATIFGAGATMGSKIVHGIF